MGQRQSSQSSDTPGENDNSQQNNTPRTTRPTSRVQTQRDAIRSAVIPVNENQRRDERRARRERLREQGEESSNLYSSVTEALNAASASNESSTITPFSRMIASVISEAVLTSFRNGQMASLAPSQEEGQENSTNVRQQLTMHLSPELFQQMEPGSTEDSFMRFMRLPVIVTSVSTRNETTAVNADGESPTITGQENQVTRIIMLPVFLYGIRSFNSTAASETTASETAEAAETVETVETVETAETAETVETVETVETAEIAEAAEAAEAAESTTATTTPTTATTATTASTTTTVEEVSETATHEPTTPPIRRSERIRAAIAAATAAAGSPPATNERLGSGQWTVYIISGNSVEGIMNDNPSYEELLDLATLIGPARLPTVSQEAIDNHVPIVKYTQQVKQTIVGNSDGCQVCLSSYQSQDAIRVLACHHGFHQECIDTWLTIGKNQCPLCRDVPIPRT